MRPNKHQEQSLMAVLVASRKMYNACLEELITHYKQTGKYLHLYEQDKRHGKEAHPDLPAVVVDTTLKRLHHSFTNFFQGRKAGRKAGFPRFKSANAWNTIQFRDKTSALHGSYFHAPKLCGGRMRVVVHRPLTGTFKFARIVKRLARAQRRLAKCKKGSNRRKKAKRIIARIHEHIVNQRKDSLHKASHHYVKHYQMIIIEDLKPVNMVKNHLLAFSIADASWGMFRQLLEAKAESAERQVIAVAPHYTSQKCSQCGEYVQKSLSMRIHVCPFCGYIADRDTNAARNILQRGLQVLARTEPSLREREGPAPVGESPLPLKREAPR